MLASFSILVVFHAGSVVLVVEAYAPAWRDIEPPVVVLKFQSFVAWT